MLEMHNYFRRLHCLLTLKLDDKLCQSALDYAKQLAKIGKLVHSKNNDNYGENLFKLTSSKSIQTIDGKIRDENLSQNQFVFFSVKVEKSRVRGTMKSMIMIFRNL